MSIGIAEPAVSLSEAQAFVRIETGEEEALLAAMVRSASAICEAFINQVLVARDFTIDLPAKGQWTRIPLCPVTAIASVAALAPDGTTSVLASGAYQIDIDGHGDGWVRMNADPGTSRVRVSGRAGMAEQENGVPEPIRHGVLRLVAHLFASRDDDGGEPPAAVTALWRPYRRMRLS
ncbi:MAG: hypothetical protein V4444_03730 [Pseudomonadota bacterium]